MITILSALGIGLIIDLIRYKEKKDEKEMIEKSMEALVMSGALDSILGRNKKND